MSQFNVMNNLCFEFIGINQKAIINDYRRSFEVTPKTK
jgi:hypothetical protein